MPTDLTFKQVCEFIKEKDHNLIDSVDSLLGLGLICSPVILGPAAVAVLPTIAVKNEIIKISKRVFESITSKKDDDYVARQKRMEIAYGLICFTAFFESLDRQIPETIRKKIGLLKQEKISLAKNAKGKDLCPSDTTSKDPAIVAATNPLDSLVTSFPHPSETFSQQIERNKEIWNQMALGFRGFVQNLAFWEKSSDIEKAQLIEKIEKIPQEASECFEAQYFELAKRYEDFAIWANLQEHKKIKALIGSLSDYVQQHAKLAESSKDTIDIGLANMHSAVLSIPETLKISQATEIVESLKRHYDNQIMNPIAEEKGENEEGEPRLHFPRICDVFIPQSFRVLRWTNKIKSLEDETTWNDRERRDDLAAFLLNYLSSPYSMEAPLVILGHPGSGKSLLTKVLSAQLMSKHYTIIRVPLREVDADAGITTQIEERIRRIASQNMCWAKISSAFKNSPPLVILDGYDELLQASGRVFSKYLKDVQNFQNSESVQERPVRVIVTSRITLIDKANIPDGATIIRLLEFDKKQRDRWISIWNLGNSNYFSKKEIKEFSLPSKDADDSAKILSLAEQPLLLLMLALYDSEGNQLGKIKSLDRTILYDSLLRRFVKREREKDPKFEELDESEQKKELDLEMQRLAVAALGMYNRRKLHILSSELNEDIKFFSLGRSVSVSSGRPMTQADLLLGSFFFIHKSKAQVKAGAPEQNEEAAAFEFLHNTFGEFLTAEFIIRQVMVEVATLKAMKENEDLLPQLEQRISKADGLSRAWFASLVYTPLFARPVVLEMMREWIEHALQRRRMQKEDFLSHLDMIVLNQIKRLLNKRELPSIIRKETAEEGYRAPFGDHPLLGHIAIYSINLFLLRIIVANEPFIFDENMIGTHEDGARPWDRLTHIWRSWFALDNLNGITAIMLAKRQNSQVRVQAKKKFKVAESQDRLETFLNVAISLGDNISSGLTGLLLFDPHHYNSLELTDIGQRLESEKIDVQFIIELKRLVQEERNLDYINMPEFAKAIEKAFAKGLREEKREELEQIAMILRRAIKRLSLTNFDRKLKSSEILGFFRDSIDPRVALEVTRVNPQAARIIISLAKEIPDPEWHSYFLRRFSERASSIASLLRLSEWTPEAALAWVQLMKEAMLVPERIEPDCIDQPLDPHLLLELSERNPGAAQAWMQHVKAMGCNISKLLEYQVFENEFISDRLMKLVQRNPGSALFWMQLMNQIGNESLLKRIKQDFFNQSFHSSNLMELTEQSPEMALAWVQMMKEAGNEDLIRRMEPEFFEHAFCKGYLLRLSERSPDEALAWLQLVKEFIGNGSLRRMEPEFFEQAFHPGHFLELCKNNPKAALFWMQIARDIGAESILRQNGQEVIYLLLKSYRYIDIHSYNTTDFAILLRLARIANSQKISQNVKEILDSLLHRADLEMLPLATLGDLMWLAKNSKSPEIDSALGRLEIEVPSYDFQRRPREMHDAVCSDCGTMTRVPFKPVGNRPVYCSKCYEKHRRRF